MQRLSTRILSFLMAIIMMLSLTTSVFANAPTDPAESNNQTEVSDQTGDENAPSEEIPVDPASETAPLQDDADKPSPQPEAPAETSTETPVDPSKPQSTDNTDNTVTENTQNTENTENTQKTENTQNTENTETTQTTQNTQNTQNTPNTAAASQPDPVPVAEAEITAAGKQLPRLTVLYDRHRIRYYDSVKQPLPEQAELHMGPIDEDDIPLYLHRAAHALGMESCGMYLYLIADPLIEDAETADILRFTGDADDPDDRMTVEVTIYDDEDMSDEEKAARLQDLQDIHIEDLQVILLGSSWDNDVIAPHSYDEETGVIRFLLEDSDTDFILFIPDYETAVYLDKEDEEDEVPDETPIEEGEETRKDEGTQQESSNSENLNPSGSTEADTPAEGTTPAEGATKPSDENPGNPDENPGENLETVETSDGTLTAEGSDYSVSLTYTNEPNVPEDSSLELSEVSENGILHESLTDVAAVALHTDSENILSVTFVDLDVKSDGESVNLDNTVDVSITVNNPPENSDYDIQVLSLGAESAVLKPAEPEAAAAEDASETGEGETGESGIADEPAAPAAAAEATTTFVTSSDDLTSTYAIVRIYKQVKLKASDDRTYLITVAYDRDDPGIPDTAELAVDEITKDDERYEDYVAQSNETTGANPDKLTFARAFDIRLIDTATGDECRPAGEVAVSIQLMEEDMTAENTKIEVVHFGEEPEKVDCTLNDETGAVEFAASGFSVYMVTSHVIETVYRDFEGETWKITATYDSDSGIPETAELVVTELAEGTEAFDEYLSQSTELTGTDPEKLKFAKAFDIKLIDSDTGKECQPTKDVKITIELQQDQVNEYSKVDVVHFADEDKADKLDCALNDEKAIEFATPGFSMFFVTVYTVDFHWGEYDWSIIGESEILLSELFTKLGITESTEVKITDVEKAEFSSAEYLSVEQQENDWLLRSLAPFDTEEKLVLTLKNDQIVEIRVTDAQDSICKVVDSSSQDRYFNTLSAAVSYIHEHMNGTGTIEMLVDYSIPNSDVVTVGSDDNITLTTSSDYTGENGKATITRGSGKTDCSLITNEGQFTTKEIIFDGGATFDPDTHKNTSTAVKCQGGIIYGADGSVLNIQEGTQFQNSAINGAGAAISAYGSLTITGSEDEPVLFTNCRGGNKTQDASGGAVYCKDSSLSISYCNFKWCSTDDADGGAVMHRLNASNSDSQVGSTTITFCRFENCWSSDKSRSGGAVQSNYSNLSITDSYFENCSSQKEGGAVQHYTAVNESETVIKDCSFLNCKQIILSDRRGGGVSTQARNNVEIENCLFSGCKAQSGGGLVINYTNVSATVKNSSFVNCEANGTEGNNGNAGGLFAVCKELTIEGKYEGKEYTFESCESNANGGAVYIADANGSSGVTLNNEATVYGCYAAKQGGGVYIAKPSGTFTLSDNGSIINCIAGEKGGGVALADGTFNMSGGSISGCLAGEGGGAVYQHKTTTSGAKSEVNLLGGTIENCSAPQGGAVYIDSGTIHIGGGTGEIVIDSCKAANVVFTGTDAAVAADPVEDNDGGAVYAAGQATVNYKEKALIKGCRADLGGGVYHAGGNFTMSGGTIGEPGSIEEAGNSNGENGTANDSDDTGDNDNTDNNGNSGDSGSSGDDSSTGDSGSTGDDSSTGDNSNSGDDSNTASESKPNEALLGGGVYHAGGSFAMSDGSISGNTAQKGGGVYHAGGSFAMSGGSISGNTAQKGGGVYHADGSFAMSGGSIDSNKAENGAGVFSAYSVNGEIIFGGTDSSNPAKIINNVASKNGGGIAVEVDDDHPDENIVTLKFQGCVQVTGNTMPDPYGSEGTSCNVFLDQDSNAVITVSGVLNAVSQIGVYASDRIIEMTPIEKKVFTEHGRPGTRFGTFNVDEAGNENAFKNDRLDGIRAVKHEGVPGLFWSGYICKITDEDGNVLHNAEDGSDAIFINLKSAFSAFKSGSFMTGEEPYAIKMLIDSYVLENVIDQNCFDQGKTVVLTTASSLDDPYPGPQDRCVISRYAGTVESSLFTVGAGRLVIENVILDGGSLECTVSGGLISVQDGAALSIENCVLRNSTAAGQNNGGAIFVEKQTSASQSSSDPQDPSQTQNPTETEDYTVSISNSEVTGCSAEKGGGIYTERDITLINTKITNNLLTTDVVADGAGVYLDDGVRLTIGKAASPNGTSSEEGGSGSGEGSTGSQESGESGSDNEANQISEWDSTSISGNKTKGPTNQKDSNLRITKKDVAYLSDENVCIFVNCNLSGTIGICNPDYFFTRFCKIAKENLSCIPTETNDLSGFKSDVILKAPFDDNKTIDVEPVARVDQADKTRIIWWRDVVCKITDKNGDLLYYSDSGATGRKHPAVYNKLGKSNKDYNGANDKGYYAFGALQSSNPNLYKRSSSNQYTQYKGECRIEMLVTEYTWSKYININSGRTVTFTTATKTPTSTDGFIYEGEGDVATIKRSDSISSSDSAYNSPMLTPRGHLILENIVLDGNNCMTREKDSTAFVLIKDQGQVTIGNGAVLKNARTGPHNSAKNNISSGAVRTYTSGETITILGNARIEDCSTEMCGGAIYVNNGSTLNIQGGSISGCYAGIEGNNNFGKGGAIYLANGAIMNMSGGVISGNSSVNGGAVDVEGSNSRLNFSGSACVYNNPTTETGSGKQKNVVLNVNSQNVIQTVSPGLVDARIGVYVVNYVNERGIEGKVFGTINGNNAEKNLDAFINDINNNLYGAQDGNSNNIIWKKVTFYYYKTWQDQNYDTIPGNDPAVKDMKVRFKLMRAPKASGGSGIGGLPAAVVGSNSFENPDTAAAIERTIQNHDQSGDIIIPASGGFFSYKGHIYIIANPDGITVPKTLFVDHQTEDYIGVALASLPGQNKAVEWVQGVNRIIDFRERDMVNHYTSPDYDKGIYFFQPNYPNHHAEGDGNDAWHVYAKKGDVVIAYNGIDYVSYVVWESSIQGPVENLAKPEQWLGHQVFEIVSQGSSGGGGATTISYLTQVDANELEDSLKATQYVVGAEADGYYVVSADSGWFKSFNDLNATYLYYAVEEQVVDKDGNVKDIDLSNNYEYAPLYHWDYLDDAKTLAGVTVTNRVVVTTEVAFTKLDGNGAPLPGATFQVFNSYNDALTKSNPVDIIVGDPSDTETANEVISSGLNGSYGWVRFGVAPGVYYMRETQPPTGYESNNTIYILLVGDSGNLDWKTYKEKAPNVFQDDNKEAIENSVTAQRWSNPNGTDKLYAIFSLDGNGKATIDNYDIVRYGLVNSSNVSKRVILRKVDSSSDRLPLEGARFTLYDYNLNEVWSTPQDDTGSRRGNGAFYVGSLPLGTYFLQETTAPASYKNGQFFEIQVRTDKIYVSEARNEPVIPQKVVPTRGLAVTPKDGYDPDEKGTITFTLQGTLQDNEYITISVTDNVIYTADQKLTPSTSTVSFSELNPGPYTITYTWQDGTIVSGNETVVHLKSAETKTITVKTGSGNNNQQTKEVRISGNSFSVTAGQSSAIPNDVSVTYDGQTVSGYSLAVFSNANDTTNPVSYVNNNSITINSAGTYYLKAIYNVSGQGNVVSSNYITVTANNSNTATERTITVKLADGVTLGANDSITVSVEDSERTQTATFNNNSGSSTSLTVKGQTNIGCTWSDGIRNVTISTNGDTVTLTPEFKSVNPVGNNVRIVVGNINCDISVSDWKVEYISDTEGYEGYTAGNYYSYNGNIFYILTTQTHTWNLLSDYNPYSVKIQGLTSNGNGGYTCNSNNYLTENDFSSNNGDKFANVGRGQIVVKDGNAYLHIHDGAYLAYSTIGNSSNFIRLNSN